MPSVSTVRTSSALASTSGLRSSLRRVWDKLNVATQVPARRMPTGQVALAVQANGLMRNPAAIWPTSL
ncbi:MAG: hypothetical protein ACKVS8_10225 [Phycisphaerales bacterium]